MFTELEIKDIYDGGESGVTVIDNPAGGNRSENGDLVNVVIFHLTDN